MNLDEFVRAGPKVFDRKHIQGNKGPNQLLYDFGVVNEEDDKEVQEKIEEIDKTFHLVMILENFQVKGVYLTFCQAQVPLPESQNVKMQIQEMYSSNFRSH